MNRSRQISTLDFGKGPDYLIQFVATILPTLRELLELIKADPNNAELHQMLGRRYVTDGQLEKGKIAYDRSLELEPRDPWTHLYLGNCLYLMDREREAVEQFQVGAALMPHNPISFVCLGNAYASLGFDSLATENYLRALELDPKDEAANRNWRRWEESSRYHEDGNDE